MTLWETWCFYLGELISWMAPIALAMWFGYWLSEQVHEFGGWKAWAKDFFGLTYNEKEDHK
jgi:hypothetical protein